MSLFKRIRVALVVTPIAALPLGVWAAIDANSTGLASAGRAAGLGSICSGNASECLATLVGRVLNVAFSFIGILLLLYVLYAGFLWLTSNGDEKQVKTAKDTIKNALIGLVLMMCAFAISSFILRSLDSIGAGTETSSDTPSQTTGGNDTNSNPSAPLACFCGCGELAPRQTSITGTCSAAAGGNCTTSCQTYCAEHAPPGTFVTDVTPSCQAAPTAPVGGGGSAGSGARPGSCSCRCADGATLNGLAIGGATVPNTGNCADTNFCSTNYCADMCNEYSHGPTTQAAVGTCTADPVAPTGPVVDPRCLSVNYLISGAGDAPAACGSCTSYGTAHPELVHNYGCDSFTGNLLRWCAESDGARPPAYHIGWDDNGSAAGSRYMCAYTGR